LDSAKELFKIIKLKLIKIKLKHLKNNILVQLSKIKLITNVLVVHLDPKIG